MFCDGLASASIERWSTGVKIYLYLLYKTKDEVQSCPQKLFPIFSY